MWFLQIAVTAPYHISFIVGLHLRAEATDIYSLSRCCIRKKLTNKDEKKTSVTPNCEEEYANRVIWVV